ncbi:glycosyltransferase family 8 protein [Deferribacterales bacterium RsTz2092]|nr:glycosyl transferase [Deferribacterales bacterium]
MSDVLVAFASDNNYVPVLSVALASLVAHTNPDRHYKIYILENAISAGNKNYLSELASANNIELLFADAHRTLASYAQSAFYLRGKYSVSIYTRLFLPNIISNERKVLYLDCDTLILRDVAELYDTELGDNYVGATRDLTIACAANPWLPPSYQTLGITSRHDYFNSGVLVLNLELMRKDNIIDRFLETVQKLKNTFYPDQDVLNVVCAGRVKFIANNWGVFGGLLFNRAAFAPQFVDSVASAIHEPYIIHYVGQGFPHTERVSMCSEEYFHYALKTRYGRDMLNKLQRKLNMWKRRLLRYAIASKLTFGRFSRIETKLAQATECYARLNKRWKKLDGLPFSL